MRWFSFLCLVLAGVSGVSNAEARPSRYPYPVVDTVGMVGDIVRTVAGNLARVELMIGEGSDPHVYSPTRADLVLLDRAEVIFYNGLFLEGRMGDVLARAARRGRTVHAVAEQVIQSGLYIPEPGKYEEDPHLWMDVTAWILATREVTEALATFDPPNDATYRANAEQFIERLRALDTYARSAVASIPPEHRVLITAHDAFQYFGRAYGIEVRGIQGLSTESEAGLRDIEQLVAFLVERRIPAVFVESSVSERNVRALVEGARAAGHELTIGGSLFSDAMGAAGTYEGTYIGMIDHNVTILVRSLGGEAPERGFQGLLSPVR